MGTDLDRFRHAAAKGGWEVAAAGSTSSGSSVIARRDGRRVVASFTPSGGSPNVSGRFVSAMVDGCYLRRFGAVIDLLVLGPLEHELGAA